MLNKTKKVAFLTTGLAGALVVSSAVGIALSSCTTTDTSSSNKPNKYTYSIDWTDQAQLKQLTIDEQGLVYSSADKTEIITVAPNTAVTSFIIPASVKYITGYNEITKNSSGVVTSSTSKGAFENQSSLISITFASDNTLISIGDSSFKGCTFLSTINLPSSTSVVYNNAFENCTNLRTISLASVSYIGSSAFKNAMANGAEVNIDLSSASFIGDNAFEGSTSLAKVDLSKNTTLTYIGKSAFSGALVSGNSTTTIDLSKAAVLKTISDNAFLNCTNLGSVILPTTSVLTTIGANAFKGATSLTQVGSVANTFTAPSSLGNYATTDVIVGSTTTSYVSSGIGTHAFDSTKIATVDLSAIAVSTPLTNATFKNMTSLANVNFGASSKITTIPYSLFENNSALTTLILPSSITSIANGVNNNSDNESYVDQKSPFYNSGLVTINMNSITSYTVGNITFNSSVQVDGTSVVPSNLFQGLESLQTVYLKAGTVGIDSYAFDGTTALTTVKEGNSINNSTTGDGFLIPTTLGWIGYFVFQSSGIKTVTFANNSNDANNNLWFLGQSAFANATSLTSVDLSQANTLTNHTIPTSYVGTGTGNLNGNGLFAIPTGLFSGATALKTISFPNSVTKIFTEAFVNNNSLTTVNFDTLVNLTSIENNNFNNTQLTNIDFSNLTDTAITSLSSSFTGSGSSIFTGLPNSAIVKLPSGMTLNSGLSTTVFTTNNEGGGTSYVAIDYPKGLDITINQNLASYPSIGSSGSTAAYNVNKMLAYVSDDFNLANSNNGQEIREYYPKTFFGNTKLKKLTLSASNLYKSSEVGGSTTYSQQEALFIHHRAGNAFDSTTYYSSSFLPFGSNSSLTDLVFTGFDINNSEIVWPTSSNRAANMSNSLYRTNQKTWAQVSTIINKFAANSINTPTRWSPAASGQDPTTSNNNINTDSVITTIPTSDASQSYTLNITNSKYGSGGWDQASLAFNNDISVGQSSELSFIHNGVTWTLNVASGGAITLVGTNINVYKASKNNSNSTSQLNPWQICFNQGSSEASTITVTLQIYTPSSTK